MHIVMIDNYKSLLFKDTQNYSCTAFDHQFPILNNMSIHV